jgi:hypothetical protein
LLEECLSAASSSPAISASTPAPHASLFAALTTASMRIASAPFIIERDMLRATAGNRQPSG